MQVADIMHTDVKTADAEDTFADVAKLMRTNGISSVVVLEGKKLAGIVTERDIVNLVAAGGDPHSVKVAHGMTRGPRDDRSQGGPRRRRRAHGEPQHPAPAGRRPGEGRGHRLDPRPHEVGRRGTRRRPRDARHRPQPQGAAGGQRSAEAASQGRVARLPRPPSGDGYAAGGGSPPGSTPAARSNGSRGCSSPLNCVMSRGNSSATVQSTAIRTRRPIVGIAHRWYERCANQPREAPHLDAEHVRDALVAAERTHAPTFRHTNGSIRPPSRCAVTFRRAACPAASRAGRSAAMIPPVVTSGTAATSPAAQASGDVHHPQVVVARGSARDVERQPAEPRERRRLHARRPHQGLGPERPPVGQTHRLAQRRLQPRAQEHLDPALFERAPARSRRDRPPAPAGSGRPPRPAPTASARGCRVG